jgi:hypothetical protein
MIAKMDSGTKQKAHGSSWPKEVDDDSKTDIAAGSGQTD